MTLQDSENARNVLLGDEFVTTIISLVSNQTGLSLEELLERNRKRRFVFARQLNMFFLARHTPYSLAEIGSVFHRDHSTVIYARDTIKSDIQRYNSVRTVFESIEEKVDMYRRSREDTKYSVFKEVLELCEVSDEERKSWTERYLNAK
tara:strand:+ start:7371 stop:7814 length:444 start_codon:yes stop_codon:yes gene_type:complete